MGVHQGDVYSKLQRPSAHSGTLAERVGGIASELRKHPKHGFEC